MKIFTIFEPLQVFLFIILLIGCGTSSTLEERFKYSDTLEQKDISVSNPNNFTFGIVGDLHGNTDFLKKIIDKLEQNNDSFLILLGDLTDKGTEEEMTSIKNCLNNWYKKTLFVIGNHDIYGDGWNHYKRIFGPTHYLFSVGNSAFIVLDTADASLGYTASEWFLETLKSLNATNIFVVSHVMPVVPTIRTYLKMSNEREATRLMKIASSNKVKAWFGAHYHSYINFNIDSVDYVIAGGGGRRLPPITSNFYVRVTVNNNNITYSFISIK